jgi:hypothetical protein
VDGHTDEDPEEDLATCEYTCCLTVLVRTLMLSSDTSIEAPPSFLPQRKYCDITGLEVHTPAPPQLNILMMNSSFQALYTDPATGLRYHDKSVYEHIKGLVRRSSHATSDAHSRIPERKCREGVPLGARRQSSSQVIAAVVSACTIVWSSSPGRIGESLARFAGLRA